MFTFIFPIISIFIELFIFHNVAGNILLIGKWFVFWAVGVRIFAAGLSLAKSQCKIITKEVS